MSIILFETERLTVRRFTADDAEDHFAIYRQPAVWRWLGGGQPYAEIERSHSAIARYIEGYGDPCGLGYWAVVVRNGSDLIGTVLLLPLERGPEIELGFHFDPLAWGKGYATEAARGAIAYAFGTLGLAEINAVVFPDNLASGRVLEKVGMAFRGMRRHFGFELMYYTIAMDAVTRGSSDSR